MDKDKILEFFNQDKLSDVFEALDDLGLLGNDLSQLEAEYFRGITKGDVNYKDRLKAAINKAFRKKTTSQEIPRKEEEIALDIPIIDKPTIVTNLIPKTESYFVGREDDLANLAEYFKQDSFIAIVGSGGMGKTQLVSKYLEKNPISNEQLCWVQCEPTTSLDSIMEQLGFSELLKTKNQKNTDKINNFVYRLEKEKRYLFLEDYHDINEKKLIEDCLIHSQKKLKDSKIILISRDRVRSIQLRPRQFNLKGFQKEADLIALINSLSTFFDFGDTIRVDSKEMLSLVKRVEGHPLAVYLAFHLLESGVSIKSIESEIINLGNENAGGQKNETISERLLNAIFTRNDYSDNEQEFIKDFSVFRGMVKKEVVLDILNQNSLGTIQKLNQKNILKTNQKEGYVYYYLHPLVREFCYDRLKMDATGTARALILHQSVAKYFIQKRLLILSIVEEERIHYHLIRGNSWGQIAKDIEKLGEVMIRQGHLDHLENMIKQLRGSYEQVPVLASALEGRILYQKGHIEAAKEWLLQAENESQLSTRIKGALWLGELLYRRGEVEEAYRKFEHVLDLLESRPDLLIAERIFALLAIGVYNTDKGDYPKSLSFYEEAELLARGNQLLSELATALDNKGGVYYKQGKYDQSLKFHEESLVLRESLGEQSRMIYSLCNKGTVYSIRGEREKALELYETSLFIAEELGEQSKIASVLAYIGTELFNEQKCDEALEIYKKSLNIAIELSEQHQIAVSLSCIGNVYRYKNKYDKALEVYNESLNINKELGNQLSISNGLDNLGNIFSAKGKYEKALQLYQESIYIREKLGAKHSIAVSLTNTGTLYYLKMDYNRALDFYEQSLKLYESLGVQSGINTILNNIGNTKLHQNRMSDAVFCFFKSFLIEKSIKIPHKQSLKGLLVIKRDIGLQAYKELLEKNLLKYSTNLQSMFTKELEQEVLAAPIRKVDKILRNTKVEVQYPNGEIKVVKYKKVQKAHEKGEVEILKIFPKD